MPLEEYRRKRDFSATPEPTGGESRAHGALTFVVHKHASRALHYDLRLEVNGVYASWAVPKGPSFDTHDKHLAVHVEDHPLEYGSFEGVIPAGEYGAGTVMIWDRGTFTPVGDPAAGTEKGDFKFALEGSKLHGQWVLVRMRPRPGDKRENWLLIKERDEYVRPHDEYDVLAAEPDSAATGRTMEEITAAGADPSKPPGGAASADPPKPPGGAASADPPLLARLAERPSQRTVSASARNRSSSESAPAAAPLPIDAPFQLATLVEEAPAGDEWIHEVKFDGYRLRVALERGRATLRTRRGADWTDRFPLIARAVEALPVSSALLDGEAVVLDAEGRSDFGLLQEALATRQHERVIFEVFDLLYLDGIDLRAETLLRRKDLLASLLAGPPTDGALRLVDHYAGNGVEYHAASCKLLLEGSVSKRGDRPWVPGRTRDWLKAKCLARQEFVVGGWTEPEGSRHDFGALLLGTYDAGGKLRYAGRVGTGFTDRVLTELGGRLRALPVEHPPFADPPSPARVHWVEPEMVVEVAFREWTRDGILRQPSFQGVREDKEPRDVVRESPAPVPQPSADPAVAADPPEADDPPLRLGAVVITNPERRLEPAGITKAALASYYEQVSRWMLPHVASRPLTIVRCPHGEPGTEGCFYQKHPEERGWPDTLKTVTIQDSGGPAVYFYVEDEEGLVSLAQLGTLEIHVWNSLAGDPERPDRIIFDLDPGPGVDFAGVVDAARTVRDSLDALGLTAFVKTTGGHGLHVVTPIVPDRDHDHVRDFAHALVSLLGAQRPDLFVAVMAKAKRPGRVFIDYLRNAHGATAVCAYSTRARPGANVSVPLTWKGVGRTDPSAYDITTVPRRLAALRKDPWDGYEKARRALTDDMFAALGVEPLP